MTVAAIEPPALSPQAATARVAELRQLIVQAQQGVPAANGGATFPAALAGAAGQSLATTAGTVPGSTPYGVAGLPAAGAAAPGTTPYDGLVTAAAQRHGIDPALLHGLIQQESGFDPNVTSVAGAAGLAQLMPGTAAALGVTDRFDPAQSIDGGARYLRQQLDAFGGDPMLALAAYNAGPGAVQRYGGVPPYAETQAYVQKVTGYADAYRAAHGAGSPAPVGAGLAPTAGAPMAGAPMAGMPVPSAAPYAAAPYGGAPFAPGAAPAPAALPPTSTPYKIT